MGRFTRFWAVAIAVVGLVPFLAAGAQAQGNGNGNGGDAAAEHARIVDFWTPARQASAAPRDLTRPDDNSKPANPNGKPGGGGGSGTGDSTGATWTGGTSVVTTTGKVFFTLGSLRYTCSGSAVDSPSGLVVLTAGHCVFDSKLGWASDWEFIPAYNGPGSAPYGTWTATSLFTTAGVAANSPDRWNDDAGFAVVGNGTSDTLKTKLGTLPTIDFSAVSNGTNVGTYDAFGYPAARPYTGNTLTYCQGPTTVGAYDGANTFSMACNMTGGSSGGPWFETFGTNPRIHGLTSYGYQSLKNVLFGPVLDGPEQTAYNAAAAASCAPNVATCTAL